MTFFYDKADENALTSISPMQMLKTRRSPKKVQMKRPQQVLCVRGLLFCKDKNVLSFRKDNNFLSIDFHECFDN